ncbi:hypothetical protein B8V81_1915 [Paenibacillus pasadenensis]|uniref:Uncharacterized protein n=1 Tax=Paenibacillus pasadenensis TaxID=217090 RepID=A0A2N5NBG6_9BACL|nr:hypothetical protein B8V81_1915 [Paenibacillus pasadenensis]
MVPAPLPAAPTAGNSRTMKATASGAQAASAPNFRSLVIYGDRVETSGPIPGIIRKLRWISIRT